MKTNGSTIFLTVYKREVFRFLKVYNQTLLAPTVTALLFLAIFSLALKDRNPNVGDISFYFFIIPGLIMMTMVQNAFANTSSSFIMGKVLGTMIDYLLPPISTFQMTSALILGGITRGICSGLCVAIAINCFHPLFLHDALLLITYSILATCLLAILGILSGIIAESFDQMAAITSYIITPLSFLSGTFYSTKNLPGFWQTINHFNPFFYMIDGFRYSMTGQADASISTGLVVLIIANFSLYAITYILLQKGYRIKT